MTPSGQGTLINICNSIGIVLPQHLHLVHSHSPSLSIYTWSTSIATAGPRGSPRWRGQRQKASQEEPSGSLRLGGHRDHHYRRGN